MFFGGPSLGLDPALVTSQKCWTVVQSIMYSILRRRNIYRYLCFDCQHHHIKEKLWLRNSKQRRGCTCEQPLVFVLLSTVFVHGKSELNGRLFTKTLHQPFDIFSAEKKKKKKKTFDILTTHTMETGKGTVNNVKVSQFLWICSNE